MKVFQKREKGDDSAVCHTEVLRMKMYSEKYEISTHRNLSGLFKHYLTHT